MSAATNSKVLSFVETAGKAIELGNAMAAKQAAVQTKVAELAPVVAQQLVDAGLIDAPSIKEAEVALSNPVHCVNLVSRLVDRINKQAAATKEATDRLGVAEKSASRKGQTKVASTEDNFVGRRRGSNDEPSESDKVLMRAAGLPC